MEKMKSQTELVFHAAILFAKDIAAGGGKTDLFRNHLSKKWSFEVECFDSVIATSLYNYGRFAEKEQAAKYAARASDPNLYAECGIDLMYGEQGWLLAELQFSYQSYPQNLQTLFRGVKKACPELMEASKESTYPQRRAEQIEAFIHSISNENEARRLVVDAWTAIKHPTRNYKELANQISADYFLFDDFSKYEKEPKYKDLVKDADKVFIFNQALLYFLDPVPFFEPILHERLEEYDSLELTGLFEDYISGKTHLANSPIIDLLNDKAIYRLLPYLVDFYFDKKLEIPVSTPHPLWSLASPLSGNDAILTKLMEHKNDWVICHRYLEAGDGIRVGRYSSDDEWRDFIENYVKEKPYLYVGREYFPMNPDTSFRIFCSGLFRDKEASIETSDELLGRINPRGSLTERSHFFLCQPVD
jgi:hypothetical protein